MSAADLLRELSARGIRVVVQGDRVLLRGPGDVLTPELAEYMRQHKLGILEAVRRCPTCSECGAGILEPPTSWWGSQPVHHACGLAAWRRHWGGDGAADARVH